MTPYHAKYFAHELTRRHGPGDVGRLSQSLFDASVDLNPHQIEAALFALKSPLSKGVLLADEVGLGKTIEAGIVLCQYWSERRRRLLVICPASLRKQWALELEEKFNLPAVVLDAKTWRDALKKGQSPLSQKAITILSYNYANRIKEELKSIQWNPDFLLWLVDDETGEQWLNFIDPKGIRQMNLHNPKLGLYKEVKVLEAKLADPKLTLNAFIVSGTSFADLLNVSVKKSDLEQRNVLFMEDGGATYLKTMFDTALARAAS
jgi:SNF2-related domain